MTRRILLAVLITIPLCAQDVTVRGKVIDDIAHRGVSRARFSLAGGTLATPIAAFSNNEGEFEFSKVAPGKYRLSIEKAGFFNEVPYGQVDVIASRPTVVPDIVLTAKRSISGTVRFRDGSFAFRAEVRVMPLKGGKIDTNAGSAATVTDRGDFAVNNLRPGRYILSVASSGAPFGGSDVFGDPVPPVPGRTTAQTYYPGTASPNLRAAIDLRTTAEAARIAMTLEELPGGVEVEGTVVLPAAATPSTTPGPQNAQTAVLLVYTDNPRGALRQVQAGPNGSFKLTLVPPGSYMLVAASSPQMQQMAVPLVVGTQPVRGLTITPGEPMPLTGKIEIEGPTPQGTPLANVRVQSRMQGPVPIGAQATANAQGEFRLNSTRGQAYDLTLAGAPSSMYIAQITQGEKNLPGGAGAIANGEPLRILLKQDGATVEGSVRAGDQPGIKAFVVLAPADRSRQDLYRTVTADAQGTFRISAIAPGAYSLLALERNEDDDYLDPELFRSWESSTVALKLDPASSKTAELKLVRIR